jgi:hypothetical protein
MLLGRLDRREEASGLIEEIIKDQPDDAETRGLAGRLDKDEWVARRRIKGSAPEQTLDDAGYESELLRNAMNVYEDG